MVPTNLDGASLAERISQTLTKDILNRSLRGGDRLVETELQNHFGVSRSPLREAFRDLKKKGLVEIRPRRGTFVKNINRKDINEHYPVLAALEGLAAREAHGLMTKKHKNDLANHFEGMHDAAHNGDVELFLKKHDWFHLVYITASGNQLLIDMIQDMRLRGTILRYFYKYTHAYCKQSLDIHSRILSALGNPDEDPNDVGRLIRSHIEDMLVMKGWAL
ncbi:GntR family transcriptional regulator [Desulforhopalus singaporensis]|uniref:DNA-binding transcriptional regulator, GntR family n=1 Tax=Desulforhopalus singaporensis TaxID=91360 RepID=A0A1H0VZW2_9BACT|nr:GntR family transcriptional regulator [Desulforhopalus singaporensis]SDP83795.1 DNA-binding transcriptional regulator, GntR family [Desulforhopalus singaporensis]